MREEWKVTKPSRIQVCSLPACSNLYRHLLHHLFWRAIMYLRLTKLELEKLLLIYCQFCNSSKIKKKSLATDEEDNMRVQLLWCLLVS